MEWQRTVYCGEPDPSMEGEEIVLNGWVNRVRDHGQILFVDLRDRTGLVQCVLDDEDQERIDVAEDLNQEDCVAIRGTVQKRPEDMVNPDLSTGGVEVATIEIHVFSRSNPLPFRIQEKEDEGTSTEQRLKYRYLDLRRPEMQENLMFRNQTIRAIREFFYEQGFLEIETPYLVKDTPGGARNFIVPNRHDPGTFFALAESPQIYKQLLMISGYEKYFQIVKCFRDEDLRKDRQPEFTQLDLEMSFVDEEDVIKLVEDCMQHLLRETINHSPEPPFPRMDFHEAMNRFGSDKPDLRYDLEIHDVSDVVEDSDFRIFSGAVEQGQVVRGLAVPGGEDFTRSDIDELDELVQGYDLPGLAWCRVQDRSTLDANIAKHLSDQEHKEIIQSMNADPGDLLLFVASEWERACTALGGLRTHLADHLDLVPEDDYQFVWIENFPLFEEAEDTGTLGSRHHPFTAPVPSDESKLEENPSEVRARAYDLVLNGFEIAGGSIRVHRTELQEKIFQALGLSREQIEEQFSFLLEALSYGPPPHGGIALGLDRFIMALQDLDSIRECIPFPRTGNAFDPMSESPSPVENERLRELGLKHLPDEDGNNSPE